MFAQHVPFDLPDFVPPFTFFFFPTFAPAELEGGWSSPSLSSARTAHNGLQSIGPFSVYLPVLSELFPKPVSRPVFVSFRLFRVLTAH